MAMTFLEFIASGKTAISEGAVLERVGRDPALALDPDVLNGGFIRNASDRARLAEIYLDYMGRARDAGLPLLAFTDAWRCSERAIAASRFKDREVNDDNARFLCELPASIEQGTPIFVGGLVGPSGDAYKPEEGLKRREARDFHEPLVAALAAAGCPV